MRKNTTLTALAAVALLLAAACAGQKKPGAGVDARKHTGMYVGVLPAADGPGILTHLTLLPDSTVALTSLYYDSDNTSPTVRGNWTLEDSTFKVVIGPLETYYYKVSSDSTLLLVSEAGEIPAGGVENYTLSRAYQPVTAAGLSGTFEADADGRSGTCRMVLSPGMSDDQMHVLFVVNENGQEYKLETEGTVVNEQVEVDLSGVNPLLSSTMVIRLTPDEGIMNVMASRAESNGDLARLVPANRSLSGNYRKVR